MATVDEDLRDQVRDRYARAALAVTAPAEAADCCGGGCGATVLDDPDAVRGRPVRAGADLGAAAGGGCWPAWAAGTRWPSPSSGPGSGCSTSARGGIDVLLSAKRVGPTGFAYELDMTDEMLVLAKGERGQGRRRQRGVRQGAHGDVRCRTPRSTW